MELVTCFNISSSFHIWSTRRWVWLVINGFYTWQNLIQCSMAFCLTGLYLREIFKPWITWHQLQFPSFSIPFQHCTKCLFNYLCWLKEQKNSQRIREMACQTILQYQSQRFFVIWPWNECITFLIFDSYLWVYSSNKYFSNIFEEMPYCS